MSKLFLYSTTINKLLKISLPLIFLGLILLASPALAIDIDFGHKTTAETAGLNSGMDVPTYLGRLAGAALALSGSIFLFLVVWGGIMIMSAAGDDTKIKKGKNIIIWAIIGVIILGAAYAITTAVFTALTGAGTGTTPPPGPPPPPPPAGS